MKAMFIAALAAVTIGITGCTPAEVESKTSQAQSQAGALLTNLAEEAQKLGEKSMAVASNITESVKGYLDDIDAPEVADEEAFSRAWDDVKSRFQDMADQAVSEENRAKIDETALELEAKFQAAVAEIRANENVQETRAAMTEFWEEVKLQVSQLMN